VIRIYHSPRARSAQVVWICEELGIPYELETMAFTPENLKSERYLRINPMGKIPTITDGDLTLFESGGIVEYLVERYGEGRLAPPPGSPERGRYLQWLHFGEGSLMPPLGDIARHTIFLPEADRIPAVVEDAKRRAAVVLGGLADGLAGRLYLCGDEFTAADVTVGYGVGLMRLFGLIGERHAEVAAYADRLKARPALQKALSV
jgi:glutathione S-transferase